MMTKQGETIQLSGLKCQICGFDGNNVSPSFNPSHDLPEEGEFLVCPICRTRHQVVADGLKPVFPFDIPGKGRVM